MLEGLDDAVALLELLHQDDVWRLGLAAQLGFCAEAVGKVGAQAGLRSAVGSVAPFKEVDIPLCFSSARATPTDREIHLGTPKRKTVTEIEPDEGAVLAQSALLLLGQCFS